MHGSTKASLLRSASTGKVFARFRFNRDELDPLIEDLNFASTTGAVQSVTQLKALGRAILARLKQEFPQDRKSTPYEKSEHLNRDWLVSYYSSVASNNGGSLIGFYLSHKRSGESRVRTILASLEDGSRAHRIYPVEAQALRFRSTRKGGKNRWAFAPYVDIPAREGLHYLKKTEEYAEQLLASKGSAMERELAAIVEKGRRFHTTELRASDFDNAPPENIGALSSAFAKSKSNPLRALRNIKSSVLKKHSRKFRTNYR